MTSPFRRRIAVLALAVSVPALSACTNGFDSQTDAVYQPSVGVNDRSSEVDVLGAMVVAPEKGKDGVFIASLVNNDQTTGDRLTAVDAQGVKVSLGDVPPIPAGGLVNLATNGGFRVTGTFKAGDFVPVTIALGNGQRVNMDVPVVTDTGTYAGLDTSSSASASPSESPSTSPSEIPSESPSESASESPSASATQ